jgi:hypothetical protein
MTLQLGQHCGLPLESKTQHPSVVQQRASPLGGWTQALLQQSPVVNSLQTPLAASCPPGMQGTQEPPRQTWSVPHGVKF